MQLLFVAVAGEDGDRVAKERQYAACKAHTTKNAHQRRRQELRKTASSSFKFSLEVPCHRVVALQPTIDSMLDRLDCHLIERTPVFDKAVSFVRFYHNASWSPMRVTWLQGNTSQPGRCLEDDSSIHTTAPDWLWGIFIASVGTFESVVASIVPVLRPTILSKDAMELESISLQLKARSFLRLRQTLQNAAPDFLPSLGLIYHVKALFREASMNGDLQSAHVHAKMLVWLVEKLPRQVSPATNLLRIALWSDAIPALLQLRRPVIEYQHWMPQLVSSIWSSAESTLPSIGHLDEGFPGCVRNQTLRAAFAHAHRALEIQRACEDGRLEYTEQIFQWMITKSEYHICSLLNLYFDLKESKRGFAVNQGWGHTEAAIALALLHIYQKSFSSITRADGVDMHESASVIHRTLMALMQDALASCSPPEQRAHRSVHSWLFSVGAMCEKRLGYSPSMQSGRAGQGADAPPLGRSDLNVQKQALQLRQECCADALDVLSSFPGVQYPIPPPHE